MAELRRFTLADGLLLAAVIGLATATRAGYLIFCAGYARNDGPLLVQTLPPRLDELADNLKKEQRFAVRSPSGPQRDIADVAPGYAVLTAVVGYGVDDAALPSAMRWLQCVLGALTAGLYFLLARRTFCSVVAGALAGVLCAVHPFWILDTSARADGVTATFLLALALFCGICASQTRGILSSLLFGLTLAALALVRAALLPFAFVALAWFLFRCRTLTRGWLCALLAFLGFVNGLAPWMVRNWQLFGEPLPIVDSTYAHLYAGNKPQEANDTDDASDGLANRNRRYAGEIWRQMCEDPAETVRRRSRAALHFLFGERWFEKDRLAEPSESAESMPNWLAQWYPLVLESTLLAMLLLALLGWRWTYAWRSSAMPLSLAVLWIPLPYILGHAEALSGPRLPLDGVLLCYAAFALAFLFPGRTALWMGEAEEPRP